MADIGILGTIHDHEMREKVGFTFNLLEKVITGFAPDIICGEVRPEDWAKYQQDSSYSDYLGPSEYRECIIPFCERNQIEFYPVDWFEFDLIHLDYLRDFTQQEKKRMTEEFEIRYEEIFDAGRINDIPLNSIEVNELIRSKQQRQGELNKIVHNITWTSRNQIICERVKKVVDTNPGKRVLCTIGVEHCYFLKDYFDFYKQYEVIFPLTLTT